MKGKHFFLAFCLMLFVFNLFSGAANAVEAKYVLKLGNDLSETHPESICLKNVFKNEVEKNSKGMIRVELYHNSQLGGTREMVEAVQMGSLEATTPASSVLAGFEKKIQVLDLPFLFKDKASAFKALDGELGARLNKLIVTKKLINLGYFENGYRHITNNRKSIKKPEDLNGLKLRTMENPMHISYFKTLGANPTPMNFGEVYTALQQKTIDGQENPIAIVLDNKFYEVQKYYSLTGHVFSVTMLLINKSFFESLPLEMQTVVKRAARNFCLANRKMVSDEEAKMLKSLKAKGMIINDLTPSEKALFMKRAEPIYEQFADTVGKDLIELAKKANK